MTGGIVAPAWRTGKRLPPDLLATPGLTTVLEALGSGENAFIVGGAIRNSLLDRPVGDIDIATPLAPEEVVERLKTAGLKSVPTGIEHGTVTAVAAGTGYEVTAFRADIETDGRRATVDFGRDMAADAARRDFTVNALYADASGTVIDPLGGMADLEAGRLRFIGDAGARIREDYLRILRFFRFHAWYADPAGGIDAEGLAACAAEAEGLEGLARERVGHEFRRLLAAPDPAPAVAAMETTGILARCLPGAAAAALAPLLHLEAAAGRGADWRARLSAILPSAAGGEDPVATATEALRLSRNERRQLGAIAAARAALAAGEAPGACAYRHGAEASWTALLVEEATAGWQTAPGILARDPSAIATEIAEGAAARLPLRAADLAAAGIAPGPAIGQALARADAAFVASAFTLDKQALLSHVLNDIGHKD
ncbi:MAG: CCA tRNA nucleotidyltransferase [Pseudomonadota bacterium]